MIRFRFAQLVGRLVKWLCRIARIGSGSVLPGRVALMLCPDYLVRLNNYFTEGCIFVTGTNGKSTTTYYLTRVLTTLNKTISTNLSGANMKAGIAAATLSLNGPVDYGVFEVDEGSIPGVAKQLLPTHLLALNFSRDQLDRYTEIETIIRRIQKAIDTDRTEVIYNAGNLYALSLAHPFKNSYSYLVRSSEEVATLDQPLCFNCRQGLLKRDDQWELPVAFCTACGYRFDTFNLVSQYRSGILSLNQQVLGCPSTELAETLTATSLICYRLNYQSEEIVQALVRTPPLPAHELRFTVPGKNSYIDLILAKNPDSFNRLLGRRTLCSHTQLVVAINARYADGLDTSWLWDVDFELLRKHPISVQVAGEASADLKLRLRVAGLPEVGEISYEDLEQRLTRRDERILVIANYTAYSELENILQQMPASQMSREEMHESIDTCLPVV